MMRRNQNALEEEESQNERQLWSGRCVVKASMTGKEEEGFISTAKLEILRHSIRSHLLLVSSHSCQPDIRKEKEDGEEKQQPDAPADSGPFSHAKHPVHRAANPDTRELKSVVHFSAL